MGTGLRTKLAQRLPFYYGWVVFAIAASTNYSSRPLMSVAVLSVFVVPMTETFSWSRGLFSGAVSLGGLCAVAISPLVGRLVDKYGSGLMISMASAVAGCCAVGLSGITQPWAFYALYVPGRMVFASPLELGTSTALSNWFVRRRALALALLSITQGTGLAAMPFVAQMLMNRWGWPHAWAALGLYTLAVGVLPALLLMARRPEDMGLTPDLVFTPRVVETSTSPPEKSALFANSPVRENSEQHFTLHQALHTRAFWVLAVFSAAGFMVQAGVSLHQVSHYLQQGLPKSAAAFMASVFAFAQVPSGLFWSSLTRYTPVRFLLALSGVFVACGAIGTVIAKTTLSGGCAAALLGIGVGGLHILLRLAWADYYGRQHLGTIRGVTLPIQIAGQALGPIGAGFIFDMTGSYTYAFLIFAAAVLFASLLVLTAVPPQLCPQPRS